MHSVNKMLATGGINDTKALTGDVGEYLRQLKSDLGTGQEGFPADRLLVADKQVHAILKKLRSMLVSMIGSIPTQESGMSKG